MARFKPIGQLGLGWLLMLAGMCALLDSVVPVSRARSQAGLAAEASVGFALTVIGWLLRRAALSRSDGR